MKYYRNNGGYTLLFAVLVATLVLSIGLYILSVTRKQLILAEVSRDSMNAFYAADSGLDCAKQIRNDVWTAVQSAVANGAWPTTINLTLPTDSCNGTAPTIIPTSLMNAPYGDSAVTNAATTTFFMPVVVDPTRVAAILGGACAWIKIGFTYDSDNPPNLISTVIESRGYNIGYNSNDQATYGSGSPAPIIGVSCSRTGPRKVERALRYSTN